MPSVTSTSNIEVAISMPKSAEDGKNCSDCAISSPYLPSNISQSSLMVSNADFSSKFSPDILAING